MAANKNSTQIFSIPETELGTKTKITETLETLKTLSTTLTTKSGDKVVSIVNINADDLKGSGDFNVDIKDLDGDGKLGVTVVNVTIPAGTTNFKTGKTLKINNSTFDDYNAIAGKVLFNFVTTDKKPYAGNLSFGMGGGVILAPSATVDIASDTGSGNFDGSVLCNIFRGNAAEVHQVEFNLIDKKYTDTPNTPGNPEFDPYTKSPEMGDILPWGAIAGVVLSASGLFLVNRKDEDEE